jgi:aminoglycoside/choline kinase family phosphotransferase
VDRKSKIEYVSALFREWCGSEPLTVVSLPRTASGRDYFRLSAAGTTVIGVYHENIPENKAFLLFTERFRSRGLPVPEMFFRDKDNRAYLLQDLGDLTLHKAVLNHSGPWEQESEIILTYKKVLTFLPTFQLPGLSEEDLAYCVPRPVFDRQAVLWDLNYFKYLCLRLLGVPFDEQALEDDFQVLATCLAAVPGEFFMYRDFQSRNIMLMNGEPWFIDYQGGRRGPLHYDPASLLFQSSVNMPGEIRAGLLDHYLSEIRKKMTINEKDFKPVYHHFVLVRILQNLGAYGLRGMIENKGAFRASIPYALKNLEWLLSEVQFDVDMPELLRALDRLIHNVDIPVAAPVEQDRLTIRIDSFSYKNGIPHDYSGYGGGFVFDCRALPNPGRQEEFRQFTGLDQPVMDFLSGNKEVTVFLDHVKKIILQAVNDYRQRHFSYLSVSFGCTGGQHRSVYCAERLKDYLERKTNSIIIINHRGLA